MIQSGEYLLAPADFMEKTKAINVFEVRDASGKQYSIRAIDGDTDIAFRGFGNEDGSWIFDVSDGRKPWAKWKAR